MGKHESKGIFSWLKGWWPLRVSDNSDIGQAKRLIAAIDRGGVPLNPAKINAIARSLGLDVSTKAPVEKTIQRIREAIARAHR